MEGTALIADAIARERADARVLGHGGSGASTATTASNCGRQRCHGTSSRQDQRISTASGTS
eukprot:684623-Prymnesium_polylepis.1